MTLAKGVEFKKKKKKSYLFQAVDEESSVETFQPVSRDIQVNEVESRFHLVEVLQGVDLVLGHVQPQQRLGDECVVKPLDSIVRDVQPLKLKLASQETVNIL